MAALALSMMALSTASQAVTMEDLKKDGPFAITSTKVTPNGFGAGTLHIPNSGGPFALAAVCPGFVSPESSITNVSKRLATHGFAVISIATKTILDFPPSRASQILAALDVGTKLNNSKIDGSRLIASGWSMGGGGTLLAAAKTPRLKAAIAHAPWNTSNTPFRGITVPTLIFGATGDIIAGAQTHAVTFYKAVPATTKKALAILQGSSHFYVTNPQESVHAQNVAWAKRFADNNAEYGPLIKNDDSGWATYESTGPF
jgi:triacylglycerol lipase